jgi:hypothetical protein
MKAVVDQIVVETYEGLTVEGDDARTIPALSS